MIPRRKTIIAKNKVDIFLHDLKNELFPLSSMENIENLYNNFITTFLSSIRNFSIAVVTKTSNSRMIPWYDQVCKDVRK